MLQNISYNNEYYNNAICLREVTVSVQTHKSAWNDASKSSHRQIRKDLRGH